MDKEKKELRKSRRLVNDVAEYTGLSRGSIYWALRLGIIGIVPNIKKRKNKTNG